jgi:hypothetical protein
MVVHHHHTLRLHTLVKWSCHATQPLKRSSRRQRVIVGAAARACHDDVDAARRSPAPGPHLPHAPRRQPHSEWRSRRAVLRMRVRQLRACVCAGGAHARGWLRATCAMRALRLLLLLLPTTSCRHTGSHTAEAAGRQQCSSGPAATTVAAAGVSTGTGNGAGARQPPVGVACCLLLVRLLTTLKLPGACMRFNARNAADVAAPLLSPRLPPPAAHQHTT